MANRRGGTERVMAKLKSSIENKNYYEAHQMYRTLYFRYSGQKKYEELESLLYEGATLLFANNQTESGLDLAKLYVENLREGSFPPEDEKFGRLCKLYQQIPREHVDKTAYLASCLKWSSQDSGTVVGHPRLHQHIAYAYWEARQYCEARQHFLHTCDGEGCGSMLVEFHMMKGFSSEVDIFITQTVLQYLCLKKHIVAALAFSTYTAIHPKISKGPPYSHHPLLNFVWLLLLAIHSSSSVSAFTVLCEKYKLFIERDLQYLEYLDKIGQLFFGVPPPARPRSMFSGLFDSLLTVMAEDSSEEEGVEALPGPSSSSSAHHPHIPATARPAQKKLETADLD